MTETAVWGFPPPGHMISVIPACLWSPHFQWNQWRKSRTLSWPSLPSQSHSCASPSTSLLQYFPRLRKPYTAMLMSTLECLCWICPLANGTIQAIFNISNSAGWLHSDLSMKTLLLSDRIQLSSELPSHRLCHFSRAWFFYVVKRP